MAITGRIKTAAGQESRQDGEPLGPPASTF